jgi:3-methyladenine DNA glycosylase AlkD
LSSWSLRYVDAVTEGLRTAAVDGDVAAMTAYMRHQFTYLGVKAPGQKVAFGAARAATGPPPSEVDVVEAIDSLWARAEREYRYAGCELAGRFAARASPEFVGHAARWITTDPWWDTCDALSRHCVGDVVRRHPAQRSTMDRWLEGDNLWLTRCALIHMGAWKADIDQEWVFRACLARADHRDFFIRKAIGWILRDIAWVDPDAVVAFVEGPGATVLSNLSKREALKNVARGSG